MGTRVEIAPVPCVACVRNALLLSSGTSGRPGQPAVARAAIWSGRVTPCTAVSGSMSLDVSRMPTFCEVVVERVR